MLRHIIRKELEAEEGDTALSMAANRFSDLITMDTDMPKLNGFDVCRKLRKKNDPKYSSHKRNDQIPIVFITANDNMKDRKRGFDLDAADFITKPFKRGEILQTVHNILMPEKQGRIDRPGRSQCHCGKALRGNFATGDPGDDHEIRITASFEGTGFNPGFPHRNSSPQAL